MNIDISNVSKPKLLAALFNKAKTQGMGWLHYKADHVMDETEAAALLERQTYFDYHEGRVMKVNLEGDTMWSGGYNMDNGAGAAERIVESLLN